MGLLSDLTPLNTLTEKEKFFAHPETNPQFSYKRAFKDSELVSWGVPKEAVASYCLEQLQKDDLLEPGVFIDQEFVLKAIEKFNHDYQLPHPVQVTFSEHYATKCRVSNDAIHFKLPIRYTVQTFRGLYRHELESHILRRANHLQNFGTEELDTEKSFRRTEEGLANLHTHLFRGDKKIKKTFLSYYSTYLSQHFSFSSMYAHLLELNMSKERAWNLCLRNKRGLSDTSLPGGFTKDICYLEGSIQVWDWLINQHKNPDHLYLGRLSLNTIDSLSGDISRFKVIAPHFLDDKQNYLAKIKKIGEVNLFAELKGII